MGPLLRLFRFILEIPGAILVSVSQDLDLDAVVIYVRRILHAHPRCPECRKKLGGTIAKHERTWRHLDIMRKRTYVRATVREGHCPNHGRRVERVPWAEPGARHTKAFDLAVASLAQVADKSATSRMFHVSWRTVGRIISRVVAKKLGRKRLDGLTHIGVDETSYMAGHRYITVVVNLLSGRVVWTGPGKSAETLNQFFDLLGTKRSRDIRVVTMDMSEAFFSSAKSHAPQAEVVYDRFHVVKLFLEAVDTVRRDECRSLTGRAREALKGTRFAFLRNPRHLQPKDEEAIRRVGLVNRRLGRLYQLRVEFEQLWTMPDEESARKFAMKWTRSLLLSRLEPVRKFARTLRAHLSGVLGYFRHDRLTNANLEGTNNKIKLLIHRAYGFGNIDSLFAMIHLCCGAITLP